jgi:hypothetical protein
MSVAHRSDRSIRAGRFYSDRGYVPDPDSFPALVSKFSGVTSISARSGALLVYAPIEMEG